MKAGRRRRAPARRRRRPALVSRVKKLERKTAGVEYKISDITNANAAISTTPVITQLCALNQGAEVGMRVGESCNFVGCYVNSLFTTETAGDSNLVRIMLIQDRQTNQAQFAAGDVLSVATAGIASIQSPLNLDNNHRFRVLFDKTIQINDQGRNAVMFRKYVKLNLKVRYDASDGAVTDLTTNSLSLMHWGINALGDVQQTIRMRYLDS